MANGTAAKAAAKPKGDNFFSRMAKFFRDSYTETFKKSSWPSWQELKSFTTVVIVTLLVVAAWIGGLDYIMTLITGLISR